MARLKLRLQPFATDSAPLSLKPGIFTVAVDQIRLRRDGDSRPLNPEHVVTLAESIVALGILEPVVIDQEGHLLAGGHRLAALQLLGQPQIMARREDFRSRLRLNDTPLPALDGKTDSALIEGILDHVAQLDSGAFTTRYPKSKIPVLVVEVKGTDSAAHALAIEAAENSVRRQYSRDEVRELAARLANAGYVSRAGRPKKGEKSARPVLEALLGCSGRQLSRLLGEETTPGRAEWDLAVEALRRAATRVTDAGKRRTSPDSKRLVELASQILGAE